MPTHLFSKQKIHANRKVCMDSTFSIGGDKRDRTADLLNAIQALSQLSYTPTAAQVQRNNCGVLTGIRTPVPTVKGSCPRPLDDEDVET